MNLLIIGDYPVATQARMRAAFPTEWQITIAAPDACAPHLADAEAVIPEHVLVDDAFLAQAPRLRFVQVGAGYDNVDLAACSRRGVQVCNAAGLNADAVAEHVMALLLCHYKNICPLNQFMHTGGSAPLPDYHGGELSGRTLGLVGLGHIGRAVAVRAQAFSLRVLGWSYRPIEIPGGESVSLSQLFAESDIVSLHVPLKANTRHLIDDAALAQMKPGALLINTARGGLIDEAALVRALKSGTLGGACLDVFAEEPLPADSPLRQLDNAILTPHTAGYPDGPKFHEKRITYFAANIQRWLAGDEPLGKLN